MRGQELARKATIYAKQPLFIQILLLNFEGNGCPVTDSHSPGSFNRLYDFAWRYVTT